MDTFNEKETLKRIPTCRHFFHAHCVDEWFKSKVQEEEQRCPQCNVVLTTAEMKKARESNRVAEMHSHDYFSGNSLIEMKGVQKLKSPSKVGNA